MRILTKPRIERRNSDLCLLIDVALTDGAEAESFIEPITEGEYKLSAVRHRQRRSLNANAYLWVMCDKIAQKLQISKTDVYRQAIKEVGVFHDMAVKAEDFGSMMRIWESNGIGWFCERFDSTLPGCVRVRCYHGSSLYDTAQMSRLIDYINDSALSMGIDTETEENISSMLERWNE